MYGRKITHILLVEDKPADAESVEFAFKRHGRQHRLTVAGNLAEARARLASMPPDLIIADINLPDGHGTDLLSLEDQTPRYPVVVMSSQADEASEDATLQAGALDYLVKSQACLAAMPRIAERAMRTWHHIAERRRSEQERRRLEAEVRHSQKLESLGLLAGGIAHDFNNLLTSILGNASLALMEVPSDSPIRAELERIETAGLRASELTHQMLVYAGKATFTVQSVNLSELVSEMLGLLESAISRKIALRCELASNLPVIDADPAQIRQVIMNLITNASDAIGDRDGTIRLKTGVLHVGADFRAGPYMDKPLPKGDYVFARIADTGCGMNAETKAKLFDPFFTTKTSGRGLGLASVLGIVRGHRGGIKVRSDPGRGTTFMVLFPRSQRAAEPASGAVGDGSRATWQCTGKILVIDDEDSVRAVATEILHRAGLTVMTARDAREGIDIFGRSHDEIAVVLLDMTMPDMNGAEAYRELRRIRSDARILLSSGHDEHEILDRFTGEGLSGFVQKPYRAASLIEKVRAVLLA